MTPAGSVRHCCGRNGQNASLGRYHVMATTSVRAVKQPPDLQEFLSLGNVCTSTDTFNDSMEPLVLSRREIA